jgi:hypothetical protein
MTLTEEIYADAEAIEHALHERLIADLGLLPDADVLRAIAIVAAQAAPLPGALGALVAADYADDPAAFARRMHAALWRAAQLHGAEALYPALVDHDTAAVPRCFGCCGEGARLTGDRAWCATCHAGQVVDALLTDIDPDGDAR